MHLSLTRNLLGVRVCWRQTKRKFACILSLIKVRKLLLYFFLASKRSESRSDILRCPCLGLLELMVLLLGFAL